MNKIFEPYFTTKHKSQGTGLGLNMVCQIITDHINGEIKISNKEFEYQGNRYVGLETNILLPLSTNHPIKNSLNE